MKKMLGIFAHPDDETAINGGTFTKYIKTGWQVDLVIATRGDAGAWGDVEHSEEALLSDTRTKELEHAAEILGVSSVTFLSYTDGALADRPPGDIEDAILRVLSDKRPDIVVTHEPSGVTNHPDHIKMSLSATFAFQTYAEDRLREKPDEANPPKLYYSCLPESIVSYVIKQKYFPQELFDRPVTGVEDKRISTVINIERFSSVKENALRAHVTQQPVLEKYMNIPNNPFLRQEYFMLRYTGVKECFMGKNDRVADRL